MRMKVFIYGIGNTETLSYRVSNMKDGDAQFLLQMQC